jgi:hypothetical protein
VKNARVVLTGEIPSATELAARDGIVAEEPAQRPRQRSAQDYDGYYGRSYYRERPYYYSRRYNNSPFSFLFGW